MSKRRVLRMARKFAARYNLDFSNSQILRKSIHLLVQVLTAPAYNERSPHYESLAQSLRSKAPLDG